MDILEKTDKKPDILKLGLVHPLPKKAIADFLKSHEEVKILEELDNIIEKEIKSFAYDEKISTRIIGIVILHAWTGLQSTTSVPTMLDEG